MAPYENRNDEHPSPTDLFKFNVHTRYYLDNSNNIHDFESFHNLPTIVCKKFFSQEGRHYLRTHFSEEPLTSDTLDFVVTQMIYAVQRSYNVDFDHDDEAENHSDYSQVPREFPVNLELEFHEGDELVIIEEFGMVPASKDGIETMKTTFDLNVTGQREILCCAICMDEFDHVNISGTSSICTMPCNHLFHQQCIVKWLQTSHTCPLCRYPMPTTLTN